MFFAYPLCSTNKLLLSPSTVTSLTMPSRTMSFVSACCSVTNSWITVSASANNKFLEPATKTLYIIELSISSSLSSPKSSIALNVPLNPYSPLDCSKLKSNISLLSFVSNSSLPSVCKTTTFCTRDLPSSSREFLPLPAYVTSPTSTSSSVTETRFAVSSITNSSTKPSLRVTFPFFITILS